WPEPHLHLGLDAAEQGRHEDAVRYFEHALRLRPSDTDLHYHLGNAFVALSRLDRAALRLGRALALRPDHLRPSPTSASYRRARAGSTTRSPISAWALARLAAHAVFLDFLHYWSFEYDSQLPGAKGEHRTRRYVAFVLRPGRLAQRVELGAAE